MQKDKQYFSILQWVVERGLVNEKGEPFDFSDRPFLLDILTDWTPQIAVTACAQIGKSVTFSIKSLFAIKHLHFNTIYTMSSDSDVNEFVSSKFNKIIQANSHEFKGMATDNVERKELNDRFIFFKGTNSKTAAISTTADLLIHDEISRSDQTAIETYKSRVKASQYKGRWLFSNPGGERDELDLAWQKSDQKEWVITCPNCQDKHHLVWPDSVNIEEKHYQCRACKAKIDDDVRRSGEWVAQQPGSKISGYHISHLMCPWIPVEDIIDDSKGDPGYFHNFVLGLAYSPGDLSVTRTTILDLWTPKELDIGDRYIGIDVGNIKHYEIRTAKGTIKLGRFSAWSELDDIIRLWKPKAGVIDAMPDNTAAKHYVSTYPWMQMSYFMENNNNPQTIVWWGENDKKGIVYSHRDRILDQMLTEMIEAKHLIGVPADKEFHEFIKHFETLRREKVTNNKGIERYVWESTTGVDHYCFVGSTPILTINGYKAIKSVKPGDFVLTTKGYKKVLHSGITKKNAEVVEATFSNGEKLVCTLDHPFYVKNYGMKPLRQLLSSDILVTCTQHKREKQKLLSTKELSLDVTQIPKEELKKFTMYVTERLEKKVLAACTKKYGKIKMARFQEGLLSTTKTVTHLIIKYLILNVLKEQNINQYTQKSFGKAKSTEKDNWKELEKRLLKELVNLKSGLEQKRGKSISKNIQQIFLQELNLVVLNVVLPLCQKVRREGSFALVDAHLGGMQENGEKNTQNTTLVTIKPIKGGKNVYNLHVEEQHEYFANGILVSNCFAHLYAYLAMQGAGSGVFFGENVEEKPVINADNVYDISDYFQEING